MSKVDFAVVRAIPIDVVLGHFNVRTRKRSATELVADCPFASHEKASHQKDTLAISIQKNRWYCHSDTCRQVSNKPKGGDVIDLVAMLENLTALDAAKRLAEFHPSKKIGNVEVPPMTVNAALGNKPLAFALKGIVSDHPALKEKGITIETAMDYGAGYFSGKGSMAGRVVFPLYEKVGGNSADLALIGYAGRLVAWTATTSENGNGSKSSTEPKWKLPNGLVRSFLYGLEKCEPAKPLVLVESPWACLWLRQNGIQAAALLGNSMTEAQERCLQPFKAITVALDDDLSGREASHKIAERLRSNHSVRIAHMKG